MRAPVGKGVGRVRMRSENMDHMYTYTDVHTHTCTCTRTLTHTHMHTTHTHSYLNHGLPLCHVQVEVFDGGVVGGRVPRQQYHGVLTLYRYEAQYEYVTCTGSVALEYGVAEGTVLVELHLLWAGRIDTSRHTCTKYRMPWI